MDLHRIGNGMYKDVWFIIYLPTRDYKQLKELHILLGSNI